MASGTGTVNVDLSNFVGPRQEAPKKILWTGLGFLLLFAPRLALFKCVISMSARLRRPSAIRSSGPC